MFCSLVLKSACKLQNCFITGLGILQLHIHNIRSALTAFFRLCSFQSNTVANLVCPDLRRCQSMPVIAIPPHVALMTKRAVIKMSMSVTGGFIVCWTSYFVVSLIRICSDYEYKLETALTLSELLLLSHSAMNPIMYVVFSPRAVRAAFSLLRQRAVPRCCRRQGGGLDQQLP